MPENIAQEEQTAFTPGPWESRTYDHLSNIEIRSPHAGIGVSDWPLAKVPKSRQCVSRKTQIANATLIAAAPEMYDALKDQSAWIRRLLNNLQYKQTGRDPKTNGYAYAEAIDWDLKQNLQSLEEALAKAEGRNA